MNQTLNIMVISKNKNETIIKQDIFINQNALQSEFIWIFLF